MAERTPRIAREVPSLWKQVEANGTTKDKLLLLLPDIAAAEAKRQTRSEDKEGWEYLCDMLRHWITKPKNNNAKDPSATPYWVSWDWAMKFERAKKEYELFIAPDTEKSQIVNVAARQKLGKILKRNNLLRNEWTEFDFINSPWTEWEDKYHTSRLVV